MTAQVSLGGRITSQAPALSAEQQSLGEVVREFAQRHRAAAPGPDDPPGRLDDQLWRALASRIGIAGLGIPEALGGVGGSYLDCHLVLAELGRALSPAPYLATMLAAHELLLAGHAGATLAAIASGERTATVLTGDVSATGPDADGGWQLSDHTGLALDGARADVLLVRAATEHGPAVFELAGPAGQGPGAVQETVRTTVRPTMDRALHLATVALTGARARSAGALTNSDVTRLEALRPVAASAVQIGGARYCLELTVEYLRTRNQFGRPLGSFQALKHRVADLLVLVETAESASWGAAAAWAGDAADAALLARVAGAYCGEAYREVTAQCVQLHGGIAITWEHEAHRHLKQAHTMATLFGTPSGHRAGLIGELSLSGPEHGRSSP